MPGIRCCSHGVVRSGDAHRPPLPDRGACPGVRARYDGWGRESRAAMSGRVFARQHLSRRNAGPARASLLAACCQ